MEISCFHMRILAHLHVNKTNFHMKEVGLKTCLSRTSQTSQQLQTDRQQTMLPESWANVENTSFFPVHAFTSVLSVLEWW